MNKIGVLIPEFPGQTHAFFMREIAELNKNGIEVKLYSTRKPVKGAGSATHDWAEEAANQTTYLAPIGLRNFVLSLKAFVAAGPGAWMRCFCSILTSKDTTFKQKLSLLPFILFGAQLKNLAHSDNIDHIHIHSLANAANIGLFNFFLGGPTYSITLHGPLCDYGPNQLQKWENAQFAIVITRTLIEQVNEKLKEIKLPKIHLAPMGAEVENFTRRKPYSPAKLDESLRLISCGRLNYVKGHDDLIRAVAIIKQQGYSVDLRICGATDSLSNTSNYKLELEQLAIELGVKENVTFLGSVSESTVKSELENAHIFCLASHNEPLGVAIMEAMSMELPVVVAKSQGVLEMIHNEVDGVLVEPKAPNQVAQAILELYKNPYKANSLAKAARVKIANEFNSSLSAEKIGEALKLLN
jgi:glycosyltransferase involved in cell wall biosynthesis